MLRLVLVRHAKSAWDEPELSDFDRPLAPRGRKAAIWIGDTLTSNGWLPRRILCSSAVRTRETLHLALTRLPANAPPPVTVFSDAVYGHRDGDYVELIREQGADAPVLMLVGHNMAMAETALALAGAIDANARHELESFVAGGIAVIDFEGVGWGDIEAGAGRLVAFRRPPKP